MTSADMALARGQLPKGWIDLTIGEPVLIRDNMKKLLDRFKVNPMMASVEMSSHSYPPSEGLGNLVSFLKRKHNVKHVVITNGAKQALSAAMFATKKPKKNKIYAPEPYWLAFPSVVAREGLKFVKDKTKADIFLYTAPNNPDGLMDTKYKIETLEEQCKKSNVPLIHDGAYYSEQYVDPLRAVDLKMIGDIQIFSFAKMYGMAGLRVGYVITNDDEYAQKMAQYMEETTMGVSTTSQQSILKLEEFLHLNPEVKKFFIDICRKELTRNREKLKTLSNNIVKVSKLSPKYENGMFAFLEKGKNFESACAKAKVKMLDAAVFGYPKMVRISLGLNADQFAEAIDKLNATEV